MELLRSFPQRAVLFLFPISQNRLLASAGFQAPAFLNQIAEFKPLTPTLPQLCDLISVLSNGGEEDLSLGQASPLSG